MSVFTLIEAALHAAGIRDCKCIGFDVTNIDGDIISVGRKGVPDYVQTTLPTPKDLREAWYDKSNQLAALNRMNNESLTAEHDLSDGSSVVAIDVWHPSGWVGSLYCCGDIAALGTMPPIQKMPITPNTDMTEWAQERTCEELTRDLVAMILDGRDLLRCAEQLWEAKYRCSVRREDVRKRFRAIRAKLQPFDWNNHCP